MGGSTEEADKILEDARLEAVGKFAQLLSSEISLAENGQGFFERKYWTDHLNTKYEYQSAMNKFYGLVHQLAK